MRVIAMRATRHEHLTVPQSAQAPKTTPHFQSRILPVFALVALSVLCYSTILAGYFYADDFPFLHFVDSFHRVGAAIFKIMFVTRVEEIQYFLFCYRPMPDVFFLGEYLINGADPFWFHAANLACHAISAVFVFFIGERLLKNVAQARLISFIAAATFAACPIYGEVVYGAMNCVSGTCAMFFFMSFALYLEWMDSHRKSRLALSVFTFACSILCKEVAAILPAVLALTYWQRNRISPLPSVTPFLAVFSIYLACRVAILGPIVGGYMGALGDLNAEGWMGRIFSIWPLYSLFPMHDQAFSTLHPLKWLLAALYAGIGVLTLRAKPRLNLLPLLGFWMVASLIPVLCVWCIEPGLGGGRHGYIAAVPLFIAAAACSYSASHKQAWCAVWTSLIAIFAYVNVRNNIQFVESSQQAIVMKQALEAKVHTLKPSEALLLLNAPFEWKGLYIFPSSLMLRAIFEPPSAAASIGNRIYLPGYWLNANYDLFSKTRLQSLCESPSIKTVAWNPESSTLEDRPLKFGDGTAEFKLDSVYSERNQFGQLARRRFFVDPTLLDGGADFLEFQLQCTKTERAKPGVTPAVSMWWQTIDQPNFSEDKTFYLPATVDGAAHTYRIPMCSTIKSLLVRHNGCFEVRLPSAGYINNLSEVKLIGWRQVAPAINMLAAHPDKDGISTLVDRQCSIRYDATRVKGAKKAVIEISRPDSLLEIGLAYPHRNYSSAHHAALRTISDDLSGTANIPQGQFNAPGIYEIEVGTIFEDGTCGYFSDPVFVRVAEPMSLKP
jgi:hypothetical protein